MPPDTDLRLWLYRSSLSLSLSLFCNPRAATLSLFLSPGKFILYYTLYITLALWNYIASLSPLTSSFCLILRARARAIGKSRKDERHRILNCNILFPRRVYCVRTIYTSIKYLLGFFFSFKIPIYTYEI